MRFHVRDVILIAPTHRLRNHNVGNMEERSARATIPSSDANQDVVGSGFSRIQQKCRVTIFIKYACIYEIVFHFAGGCALPFFGDSLKLIVRKRPLAGICREI